MPLFDPDAYQRAARATAVYPAPGRNLTYPALGLAGESGEVLEKVLAAAGDGEVRAELGDVLWYISQCSAELGLRLTELAPVGDMEHPDALCTTTVEHLAAATETTPGIALALAARLCVGAGKVCETVKKVERDRGGAVGVDMRERAAKQLRTTLHLLEALAFTYHASLASIAAENLDKLSSRAASSTLHGDGDRR